jgi:hypothetical protein
MAISEWWAGDPSERFWMEITDRSDLGANLHAPQKDAGGNEYWSYDLVRYVKPGDIVFHWWKPPGEPPAIVAWSRAADEAAEDTIRWLAHGTYARGRAAQLQPSWYLPLEEFTNLASPLTLEVLRRYESQLSAVKGRLSSEHGGSALYFPFVFSDKRPMRTTQGYLVKVPSALVDAIPELAAAFGDTLVEASSPKRAASSRRQSDVEVKIAIERHAVEWAMRHFSNQGFEVFDVGATHPYDILATRSASDDLHIEVKGSSSSVVAVDLTSGEVDHARNHEPLCLVVVDQIDWLRTDGKVVTSGGRVRLWRDWEIEDDNLTPTAYRYVLAEPATGFD